MAKPFQEYLDAVGLELTAKTEFAHGEAASRALAKELEDAKTPDLAVAVTQALLLNVRAAGVRQHCRIAPLAQRIGDGQPQMVQGQKGVKLARAVAVAAASQSGAGAHIHRLLFAMRDGLLAAAAAAKDDGVIHRLLGNAEADVAALTAWKPGGPRPADTVWGTVREKLDGAFGGPQTAQAVALAGLHGKVGGNSQWMKRLEAQLTDLYRLQNLSWWAEAGWSGLLNRGVEEIGTPFRGFWMAEEYAHLAPAGRASESFLLRTLTRDAVTLTDESPRATWLKAASAAYQESPEVAATLRAAVPAEFVTILRQDASGFPVTATLAGLSAGGEGNVPAAQWYREIFRERQVLYSLFPHVAA